MLEPIVFFQAHQAEWLLKLEEQFFLVSISMLGSLALGIPLGIIAARFPKFRTLLLGVTSAVWTIPSLALLAVLIPWVGIGMKPAIIALTIYALLPILRNTTTGISEVSPSTIEAAKGLGLTRWQQLYLVELPLAFPFIMTGIRTGTSMCIGIATLAAFIGAGGFGDFINRGLSMNDPKMTLLGGISAAIMALVFDFFLAQLTKLCSRRQRSQLSTPFKWSVSTLTAVLVLVPMLLFAINSTDTKNTIRIATKNFTEQYILGEMMAQMIEHHTQLKVKRIFNLGTTAICHQALRHGEIDMYPEYTGTAYLLILKRRYNPMLSSAIMLQQLRETYQTHYDSTWLAPFGFSNSQSLAVRQDFSTQHNLTTITELQSLAPQLVIAAPPEFLARADGMSLIKKNYEMQFKQIKAIEPSLMYSALYNREVDTILAYTTDGRIPAFKLKVLQDDKHIFPPYNAAIVIRLAVLTLHPELKAVLLELSGKINFQQMQKLNAEVDQQHITPEYVAQRFLLKQKLI